MAGAELATAPEAAERLEAGVSKVTAEMVERLEADIDRYMERVDLPPEVRDPRRHRAVGPPRRGSQRPAPRRAARGASWTAPATTLLAYLNRASDALFAMARFADEPDPELFEGRS